jgi:hypothetical protein
MMHAGTGPLMTFGPLVLVVALLLFWAHKQHRLGKSLPYIIGGSALLVGWWYFLERNRWLFHSQPIAIPATLHLMLNVAGALFGFALVGGLLYYRIARHTYDTPPFYRYALWVLLAWSFGTTFLLRY